MTFLGAHSRLSAHRRSTVWIVDEEPNGFRESLDISHRYEKARLLV